MLIWDFELGNIIDCNEEAILPIGYTEKRFLQLSINGRGPPKEDFDLIDSAIANKIKYMVKSKKSLAPLKKKAELMLMEVTGPLMITMAESTLVLLK